MAIWLKRLALAGMMTIWSACFAMAGETAFLADRMAGDERAEERQASDDDALSSAAGEKARAGAGDDRAWLDPRYLINDIEDIAGRLDRIETETILQKIRFSGEFRTRLEHIRHRNIPVYGASPSGSTIKSCRVNELWSNRLRINFRSDVTENIIFHGRFSYYKLWGQSNVTLDVFDFNTASVPDIKGTVYVERAYIDYFFPDSPLSLTFGRLPTSEGPPNELKDFTTRKGTWPQLMNDVQVDGVIATLALAPWSGLRNAFLRGGYTKIYQRFPDRWGDADHIKESRGYVAALETEIPSLKDSVFWVGYTMMNTSPPAIHRDDIALPDDMGDIRLGTVHVQLPNIRKRGVDVFVTAAWLRVKSAGKGIRFDNGYEMGLMCDNLHENMGASRDGSAVYAGLRYRTPFWSPLNPRLGLEYVHGSRYWTGLFSSGGGDLINKLDVSGHAWEIYCIQPIHPNRMYVRVGAIHIDYDYASPFLMYGARVKTDETLTSLYFLADIRF